MHYRGFQLSHQEDLEATCKVQMIHLFPCGKNDQKYISQTYFWMDKQMDE